MTNGPTGWGFDRDGNVIDMRPWSDLDDLEIVEAAALAARWALASRRRAGVIDGVVARNNTQSMSMAVEEAARRGLLPTPEELCVAFDLAASLGQEVHSDDESVSLVDLWVIHVRSLRSRRLPD